MSWADFIATGRGWFGLRLEVEGWPHVWVTDSRITFTTNLDSRIVYPGLQFSGMRISERADLKEAWVQCSGITARILPSSSGEDTVDGFTRDANQVGTLLANGATAGVDYNDAAWVTRPTSLPSGFYHLGTEAVLWSGSNLYRQRWSTQPQDHMMLFAEQIANPVPIYDWPPTMEGRRAFVYAYGTDDVMSGNGTCIWRGVVARPPRMLRDGVGWEININPITAQFDQEMASSPVEYKIRGIYHSRMCPMVINVAMQEDDDDHKFFGNTYAVGFFENRLAWLAEVNSVLATFLSDNVAVNNDVDSIVFSQSRNAAPFYLVKTNASLQSIQVAHTDALDGDMWLNSEIGRGRVISNLYNPLPGAIQDAGAYNIYPPGGEFLMPNVEKTNWPGWAYPLPPARTMIGTQRFINATNPLFDYFTVPDETDWPEDRVYLESVDGLEVGMVLAAKNGEDVTFMRITAVDADDDQRHITVDAVGIVAVYLSSDTVLVPVGIYGENTNWAGFMASVVTQSTKANLGTTPFITAADVAVDLWDDIWTTYPINDYWRYRAYKFVHPTTVKDVLTNEFRATGFMARIAADGRLDVTQMPFVAPQQSAVATITDDDILYPGDDLAGEFPAWAAQTDGLVNIANVKLGYNPISDEFDSRYDFQVRMVQSIAEHRSGNKATADIAPKSTPGATTRRVAAVKAAAARASGKAFGDTSAPTTEMVTAMALPYLRTLSEDYAVVEVTVPFTKFHVLIGDIVEVSCSFLPDGLGTRGMSSRKGICIGREWNLDPAQNAMGKLTIWFPRNVNKTAGYCPTGRITSQSGSGTTWTVTCASVVPANLWYSEGVPPGAVDAGVVVKHFAIGDAISIVQVDATIPTVRNGTVTSVDSLAGTIGVTLTASWTPSSTTWNITFRYNGFIDRQQAYCWVADANGARADGSAARLFV